MLTRQIIPAIIGLTMALQAFGAKQSSEVKLYRYNDADGVKVIGHTLPPEYAQKGYEVLNTKGQVLKIVPPALSSDEVARKEADRLLLEKYENLRRRYSTVDDIERAKNRRLQNINTNISIIRGNIGSISTRIDNLMNRAATLERAGKPISSSLLQELSDSRAELSVAQSSLENRLDDYRETEQRFKREILTFTRGNDMMGVKDPQTQIN